MFALESTNYNNRSLAKQSAPKQQKLHISGLTFVSQTFFFHLLLKVLLNQFFILLRHVSSLDQLTKTSRSPAYSRMCNQCMGNPVLLHDFKKGFHNLLILILFSLSVAKIG